MDFRSLNTFVQVAECGSFTRAAEILGYSQPTISIQIVGLMYKIKLGHTHDITAEDIDTVIIEEMPIEAHVENPVEAPSSVIDDYDIEIIDFPLEHEDASSLKS